MNVEPDEMVAAVDCGTNSTRMLVADGRGRAVERVMRITRLGQGVDATHKLAPEAVARTLQVLAEFRRTMDALGVTRGRLVATSAVRDASDGERFLAEAGRVSGLQAEVLSGEEEGRTAYAGAAAGLSPVPGDDVVVDIGGGSTELVLARKGSISAVSLDLGCVRLTERHFHHDPPLGSEVEAAVTEIRTALDRAVREVPELAGLAPGSRLLGLAGTVATLAALEQGLAVYDRDRIHHTILLRRQVDHWCETLAGEPADARGRRPGMDPGRHDVIVGGVLVLREVMDRLGFDRCLESESDILDGLVAGQLVS